jgi:acetyltransferase-like isoleucine patch superfamily enzyme
MTAPPRNALIFANDDQEGEDRIHIAVGVCLEDAILNVVCGSITIGRGTFCGHGVKILTGSHRLSGKREMADQGRDIVIGEDVWLASGCIILGPCKIGDRCVIAAGAVVTRDCEAGWIYAGVPAKKLRLAVDAEG